jgi:hypothetical protein
MTCKTVIFNANVISFWQGLVKVLISVCIIMDYRLNAWGLIPSEGKRAFSLLHSIWAISEV